MGSVEDRTIPGPAGPIPIRIYRPQGSGPFPLVLYIHGGGWVIANIDTYDSSARALTNAAGAIVVSTHYRQGPENFFPAAHDDTYQAYRWVVDNAAAIGGQPGKVAVAGESAGGNMAASITIRARNDGALRPVHQVLIYPVIDGITDSASEQQNRDAAPLNTASLIWFFDRYLAPADRSNPLFAVEAASASGLPSATVITADIDPLRSEGLRYARHLRDGGVTVDHVNYTGVTHEFFGMGAVLDKARDAVTRAGAALRVAFAAS